MKRAVLISLLALAATALAAPAALADEAPGHPSAAPQTFTIVLAGGAERNAIRIWLSADGRELVIDSVVPLEVGGSVCRNPAENPNELLCRAPLVAGFEVNSGPGNDRVVIARNVAVPVTIRGAAGDDLLVGGAGGDKILGGRGDDRILGWRGGDFLHGGLGDDRILGGPDPDLLRGGLGLDLLWGGGGLDDARQFRGLRGVVRG